MDKPTIEENKKDRLTEICELINEKLDSFSSDVENSEIPDTTFEQFEKHFRDVYHQLHELNEEIKYS